MRPQPPRRLLELAEEIVAEWSATDLPILSVVTQPYFESAELRRKMAGTVQELTRRQLPTAFDAAAGSLLVQLTLVLLNGIAAGSFDDATAEPGGRVADQLARLRLSRRLRHRRAADGADTPVPPVTAAQAAQIAAHTRRLARRSGLSEPDAEEYAALVVGKLTVVR